MKIIFANSSDCFVKVLDIKIAGVSVYARIHDQMLARVTI